MRFIVLVSLLLSATTLIAGTTLYRWVDEKGHVHYSDQPRPEAQEIQVGEPPSYHVETSPRSQTRPASAATNDNTATTDDFPGYESLRVTSPTPDQVLWNLGGVLNISLSVQPTLQPGHQLDVQFNGRKIEDWPARATRFQLKDIYRGTHTVSVSISDANGKQVASGEPVTFHVKQTSIQN